MLIARMCEECYDRHDPDRNPNGGARYLVGTRWYCAQCHEKKNGPLVAGRSGEADEHDDEPVEEIAFTPSVPPELVDDGLSD